MSLRTKKLFARILPLLLASLMLLALAPRLSNAAAAPQAASAADLLDINCATKHQLVTLPGIGDAYAHQIMAGRPYKAKADLVKKHALPKVTYNRIKDRIIAIQSCPLEVDAANEPTTPVSSSENEAGANEGDAATQKQSTSSTVLGAIVSGMAATSGATAPRTQQPSGNSGQQGGAQSCLQHLGESCDPTNPKGYLHNCTVVRDPKNPDLCECLNKSTGQYCQRVD